ncbi:MAG TPA: PEP-CTERM sorting domain-containing protein, partial [Pirellulales bacterium]|nr:PEP-CTERM sorting domain-containing protein [Pirellulales bacterium]
AAGSSYQSDYGADGLSRSLRSDDIGTATRLYTINPSTGLGTLLGPTTLDMVGIASIPEPSTFLLLALGALTIVAYARRRPTSNSSP